MIAPGSHEPHRPRHDFHVFVGHVVAQVVLGHALHAEVHRREVGAAGDGVPADASARHLVERRHQAGQQIGMIGVGAEGRHDADARRHLRHQRRHHRRVLARHGDGVLEVDLGRAAEALADIGRVLEQDVVEAGALQGARHVQEQLGLHPGLADMPGPRLGPRLHARALQEPREMKRFDGHCCAPQGRIRMGEGDANTVPRIEECPVPAGADQAARDRGPPSPGFRNAPGCAVGRRHSSSGWRRRCGIRPAGPWRADRPPPSCDAVRRAARARCAVRPPICYACGDGAPRPWPGPGRNREG